MYDKFKQIDTKELNLPDTIYSRDIEGKVFQGIICQCLAKIEGVVLVGGTFIDSLLGRDSPERVSGIYIEQDPKTHAVSVKLEVNIKYGVAIPDKAEEIQNKIVEEISRFTGLHVSSVHVIFKNVVLDQVKVSDELEAEENFSKGF
ncbi:MAG: Asp23/Gls24 family envelope stress response protein [Chlamydiae bacterium]|nr:Asp23/Gls24 family envelope stress response protein [Chlamydiota bacterium]